MVRTQVSLEQEQYRLVKQEAAEQGVSVAEFVRRAVADALRPRQTPMWMRYAGLVESGDPQSSRHIDDVVYGEKD